MCLISRSSSAFRSPHRAGCAFAPYPPTENKQEGVFALDLAQCSAYGLRDDARWRWQHRIPTMKSSRYSITFRMTHAGKTAIENLTNPAQWMIGRDILIKTAYRK